MLACPLLVVANMVNIGADLAGMAEALEMVTGLPRWFWQPFLALGIVLALIFWSYRRLARTFKLFTLVLFAYVFGAFRARPDWGAVLQATFVPRSEWTSTYLMTLVAILGTTITPYRFFWQASQEEEEERALGRLTEEARRGATREELRSAHADVLAGMGWAGLALRGRSERVPGATAGGDGDSSDQRPGSDGRAGNPPLLRLLGWTTTLVMAGAGFALAIAAVQG